MNIGYVNYDMISHLCPQQKNTNLIRVLQTECLLLETFFSSKIEIHSHSLCLIETN